MSFREHVLDYLKNPNVVKNYGVELREIKDHYGFTDRQLNETIRELKSEKLVVAVPFKQAGRWHFRYYSPPTNKIPIRNRIEDIFTELAIPPWVKTRVFRGAHVIFVGEFGKEPGFTIIDYSEDTPLVFHDRFAGGNRNEIVDYKYRSKYKCTKDDRVIWYSYKGQKVQVSEK